MSEKIPRFVQRITYWPTYLLLKLLFHYQIAGQENLKGLEKKGVIFVSNHTSLIDGPLCAAAMPREGLTPKNFFPVKFLAAKEYCEWFNPRGFFFPLRIFTTPYAKLNGCIPVNRERDGGTLEERLEPAIKVLRAGAKVWIYPEGHITKDGKLQFGKKGAAFLQQATGCPIVPVGLIGTFKILSAKSLLGRKTHAKTKIGQPFFLPESISLEESTKIIMQKIAQLL